MHYLTRLLAFYSYNRIRPVGCRFEVLAFFRLIDEFVTRRYPEQNVSLITDRFYRRYIAQEDAAAALEQMAFIETVFEEIPSDSIDWNGICSGEPAWNLNYSLANCRLVFEQFFTIFRDSHGRSAYFFEHGRQYQPVRILRAKLPYFAIDKARPLSAYDGVEGDPFWLRPDETNIPDPPSYKGGKIVPDGTPGSVKPDYLSPDAGQAYFIHKLEPEA